MTPTEGERLASIGTGVFRNAIPLIITLVFFGFGALVAIIAFYVFMSKGIESYSRKALLACMVALVVTTIWNYIYIFGNNLSAITFDLVKSNQAVEGNFTVVDNALPTVQSYGPGTIQLIINDGLIAWRACTLWQSTWIIRCSIIGIMAVNIVLGITQWVLRDVSGEASNDPTLVGIFVISSAFSSVIVNLVATSAIALKAYYHFRELKLSHRSRKGHHTGSPVFRMLLLLLESGGLFCVGQMVLSIVAAALEAQGLVPCDLFTFNIYYTINSCILPMYPLAVVILISFLRVEDNYLINCGTV